MLTTTIIAALALTSAFSVSSAFAPDWLVGPHRPKHTQLLQSHLAIDETTSYDAHTDSVVSVSIKRVFPYATPLEARDAWIEHHWKKGGGLPIVILSSSEQCGSDYDGSNSSTKSSNALENNEEGGSLLFTRTILPVLMKESFVLDKNNDEVQDDSITLQYIVTEAGPFYADVVPGSHSAVVTFSPTSTKSESCNGCEMTWDVNFSTTKWSSFYKSMTEWTVGTASSTIEEALTRQRQFIASTKINVSGRRMDPVIARRESLDFFWSARGGGLPLIPPIPTGKMLEEGSGKARENLLRIPPLLTESIIGTNEENGKAEFTYQLNNPGWTTFPFLIHTHFGRVQFESVSTSDENNNNDEPSSILLTWEVEIRPFKFAAPIIEKMVEMVVTTIIRNLRVCLMEPGALVVIQPPRGNKDLLLGRDDFGSVAKETWLGGVLYAHLSDKRSTVDQTVSLLQPWTWGRSGTGGDDDCVKFKWSDGK